MQIEIRSANEVRISGYVNAVERDSRVLPAAMNPSARSNFVERVAAGALPDCIVQPYMFGDAFEKKTCFWLKGLPVLKPTNPVTPPPRKTFKSGNSMPTWYSDAFKLPDEERTKLRSKTFPGIAAAMAAQWTESEESE